MAEDQMDALANVASPSATDSRRSAPPILAFVCSAIGLLSWSVAFAVQGDYRQGERLAAYFGALVNVGNLVILGSIGTVASLIGLVLARRELKQHRNSLALWRSQRGLWYLPHNCLGP